jgi:hypothetical protein
VSGIVSTVDEAWIPPPVIRPAWSQALPMEGVGWTRRLPHDVLPTAGGRSASNAAFRAAHIFRDAQRLSGRGRPPSPP